MTIAVIPARGGSKRIPHKNTRSFSGKPVIAYSIAACQEAKVFQQILVSTDDPEIAEIAIALGADVPFLRPASVSDDHSGTDDVMAQVLDQLAATGVQHKFACCVYATAPFIRSNDLLAGWREIQSAEIDYVFSASTYAHPIYRAFTEMGTGGLTMVNPQRYHTRSQDLPVAWHDAAQFYWGKTDAWLERRPMFDFKSRIVAVPRWRVQDIDTYEDWHHAELMWRVQQDKHDAVK